MSSEVDAQPRLSERQTPSRPAVGYLLIRLTGAALAVLVVGHLVVTHVVNDVADTDADFIARQWSSALWLTWDSLLLAAAVAHGTAGLWIVVEDYAPGARACRRLHRLLLVVAIALVCTGSYGLARAIYS